MLTGAPITAEELVALEAESLGGFGAKLLSRIEHDRQEIDWRDAKLEKLSFEMAQHKRMKFGKKSEQGALFDEAINADIAATEERLKEPQDSPIELRANKHAPRRALVVQVVVCGLKPLPSFIVSFRRPARLHAASQILSFRRPD